MTMNKIGYANSLSKSYYWLSIITVVIGLYLTTYVNYLLFHSIVELFSVVIASTVFIITWKSVRYIKNPYLMMVGISYLFGSSHKSVQSSWHGQISHAVIQVENKVLCRSESVGPVTDNLG
ncbi:MAG: MASE3 domain-containing protein, partial [Desulfuromonadaceae bacterium]|nr:MASE3 domain-containing protein [Desulfuromonadaceae bacterium]